MKKKYQVFISSTYKDLIDERQAAVEAILKAGHIPAGMELFKSGNSQLLTIKKWIDESDIYLLILGKRYGSIDNKSNLSYTEIEYRYAIEETNKPGFAIIMSDEVAERKLKNGLLREDIFDDRYNEQYTNFKNYIMTKIVSFANSIAEVKLAIHENMSQYEEVNNLAGWIKGDSILNSNQINELQETTKENSSLRDQINELKKEIDSKNQYNLADLDVEYNIVLSYSSTGSLKTLKLNKTWNQLFALISPYLISPQNDAGFKIELSKYLFSSVGITQNRSTSIHYIDDQQYFTIRTQLEAYGLIYSQYSNTTAGDMALFWTLTQKGKNHMFQLRTIHKSD